MELYGSPHRNDPHVRCRRRLRFVIGVVRLVVDAEANRPALWGTLIEDYTEVADITSPGAGGKGDPNRVGCGWSYWDRRRITAVDASSCAPYRLGRISVKISVRIQFSLVLGMSTSKAGGFFELSQLRCFVAAAEELHFGQAAARLNMTQPPLSRQIQLLEQVLGVKLLDRNSRIVRVTPAGRVFLLEARRILRLSDSAALTTRRTASGEAGTVTLGFTAAAGYNLLPRLIGLFKSRLPNVNISLMEMVTTEQIEALLTRRIDLGLMRPLVDRAEFSKLLVATEPLVAALPSGDARLAKNSLSIADFDQLPLIMYAQEGARYSHDILERLFDIFHVTPVYVQHLSQVHSMLALVHSGLGAALVPEAATSLHFDGVHFRPVTTRPAHPLEFYAAWRSDHDNPALEPLLDLMRLTFALTSEPVTESA